MFRLAIVGLHHIYSYTMQYTVYTYRVCVWVCVCDSVCGCRWVCLCVCVYWWVTVCVCGCVLMRMYFLYESYDSFQMKLSQEESVSVCGCVCVWMSVKVCVCVSVWMDVCVCRYVRLWVCRCVRACWNELWHWQLLSHTHTHTHTHAHTQTHRERNSLSAFFIFLLLLIMKDYLHWGGGGRWRIEKWQKSKKAFS